MPKSEPRGVIRVLHTDEAPAIFWRAAAAMGGRECDRIRLQDALAEKYPGVWSAKDLSRSMALLIDRRSEGSRCTSSIVRGAFPPTSEVGSRRARSQTSRSSSVRYLRPPAFCQIGRAHV